MEPGSCLRLFQASKTEQALSERRSHSLCCRRSSCNHQCEVGTLKWRDTPLCSVPHTESQSSDSHPLRVPSRRGAMGPPLVRAGSTGMLSSPPRSDPPLPAVPGTRLWHALPPPQHTHLLYQPLTQIIRIKKCKERTHSDEINTSFQREEEFSGLASPIGWLRRLLPKGKACAGAWITRPVWWAPVLRQVQDYLLLGPWRDSFLLGWSQDSGEFT